MFGKVIFVFFTWLIVCTTVFSDVYVEGYYRKNGTYVKPHYRSNPDGNIYTNFSTKGNINPYTGKYGKVIPPTLRKKEVFVRGYYQKCETSLEKPTERSKNLSIEPKL